MTKPEVRVCCGAKAETKTKDLDSRQSQMASIRFYQVLVVVCKYPTALAPTESSCKLAISRTAITNFSKFTQLQG
jgi:hypothetical protein